MSFRVRTHQNPAGRMVRPAGWGLVALLFLAATGAQAGYVSPGAWSFGVIGDTQQTINSNSTNNSCAIGIIAAVNQQFIARGVNMVIQVGDLCDDGSVAGLQTRLNANANLATAGIPFYGLRGNHEDNSPAIPFFHDNYIPSSSAGVTVHVAPDNMSYSVNYKDATFVLLDILATKGDNTLMDQQTAWMSGVLSTDGHQQAFVFQHKNLLGQNHKDNAFGSGNDSNPDQQNAFFAALADNNVKYDISGHDHMNHRSIVTSPDGLNTVQEIITQSDSTKFYTSTTGFSTREQSISDQQNQIGYYVFTIDGPRVTGQYYATTPVNSDIPANPVWTLQDTFGYSLNGKQFTIARGGAYAGVSDAIAAGAGFQGTAMQILAGTNTVTATAEGSRPCADDLNTGWSPRQGNLRSDILSLWGMNNALGSSQTDPFVLSMTADLSGVSQEALAAGMVYLAARTDDGDWVKAVDLNYGGAELFVAGPYESSYGLGTYGVDAEAGTVWAVLNHNSDFAADIVPEPATLMLLGLGLAGLGKRLRRRLKRA